MSDPVVLLPPPLFVCKSCCVPVSMELAEGEGEQGARVVAPLPNWGQEWKLFGRSRNEELLEDLGMKFFGRFRKEEL